MHPFAPRPATPARATQSARLRSLDRGLAALDLVLAAAASPGVNEGVSVTDIAAALDVDKSSASRIARTLSERGYLTRDPRTRRFVPGAKLHHAASRDAQADLLTRARPFLYALMARTGECAHTAVMTQGAALIIDDVESAASLRVTGGIGRRNALHATAVGKALLAFADAELPEQLERLTERTITSFDVLFDHVADVRRLGYAVDDEENERGVRCIAAPVFDHEGTVIASIGISGPMTRVTLDAVVSLAELVLTASRDLSVALGWRGDDGRGTP